MVKSNGDVSPGDIFTTLRYNPALHGSFQDCRLSGESSFRPTGWYMFQFHLDRLQASAAQFQCMRPSPNKDHLAALDRELKGQFLNWHEPVKGDIADPAWRVRLVLDSMGGIQIDQVKPVASLPCNVLYPETLDPLSQLGNTLYELFLCPHPTTPSSFTRHKTALRDVYTAARVACNLSAEPTADPVEVLVWNPDGELMEGSLTSVYCRRDGHWVTPATKCGGNEGTTRRWAIEMELCTEGPIMINDLIEGEILCISNGVRGFIYGIVRRQFYDVSRRSGAS